MTITLDDIRAHLRRTDPDAHGDRSYAVPMVDAMEARAEFDAAYTIELFEWLAKGGTVLLRDVLAAPFKDDPFVMAIQGSILDDKHPYAWNDIWMAVDSARHAIACARSLAEATTEEAPTAPADEAPDGCDSRLSPCGTYMIHEHDCPEAIEHGWPRENAPGAHVPNPETVAALEDSRAGRTHRAASLHDLIVDAVAEALQMQGDGTGDHMQGLLSMHPAPKHKVEVTTRVWERKGHGGTTQETDYAILLNGHRLRGYSTHGNMQEGYWGSAAKAEAEKYAAGVRAALGMPEEGQ